MNTPALLPVASVSSNLKSDRDLLRDFAENHDNRSFAQFVERHLGFVYAVCLRRLRDPHAAQDAAQGVFIALARKARSVANAPSIMGWLHRSACYETRNLMRSQHHRRARELEAQQLGTTLPESRPQLEAVAATLDDALCELSASDREAILARYFSQHSYATIGASLRLTENAARMRVERALVKLRACLERRGVTSTAAVLATALPSYASAAVPSGLAAIVTKAAVVGVAGTAGTASAIGFMSTSKLLTGAAAIVAAGGFFYQQHHASALQAELVTARAESAASTQHLETLQREVAALRAQQEATQAAAARHGIQAPTASAAVAVSAPPEPGVTPVAPRGWFQNGNANELYQVGVDDNNAWGGMPSAYAKSTGDAKGKFGGMMQTISADAYKNQRVRLTGWVKTEDAADGGHLWLRVDGPQPGKSLQFDNMSGRAPKGTTDWEEYSIVLDVAPEATRLNYGFFVAGKGKMWVNGLTITPVGTDVPTTSTRRSTTATLPQTPVNLGFAPPTN